LLSPKAGKLYANEFCTSYDNLLPEVSGENMVD
jgi:hypothetical protein